MLSRQAKILSKVQVQVALDFIARTRSPQRNRVIFLLSVKAGLRAKEIAHLSWGMVTTSEGEIADAIHLTDGASKGSSGGVVPLSKDLRLAMIALRDVSQSLAKGDRVITTERAKQTSPQAIVNLFWDWYGKLGFDGCSSHSGRRTFITNAARNISRFGGSLRDVQALARHRSLSMTQRYIEIHTDAMRKVVDA